MNCGDSCVGIVEAIKQLIIKYFEPCVSISINESVDRGDFNDDDINALEMVALTINLKMNKKFKRLFQYFPVDNIGITSDFEYLRVFGIYPFKGFREKHEFHIEPVDVYRLILTIEPFKHFQSLFINEDSDKDSNDEDEYIENDSDGLN